MTVELNHTVVAARDGPFVPVETSNAVTLDFLDSDTDQITPQHYAFLVSEEEFDAIFARIRQAGLTHYADPAHQQPGQINHNNDGGRGTYFDDPNGHNLEILTRPYGSGG